MKLYQKIICIVAILTILAGISAVAFPFISNWINQNNATSAVYEYNYTVEQMNQEQIAEERDFAENYNNMLNGEGITDPFQPESGYVALNDEYEAALSLNEVMAYIEIPEIDVFLPIYHGTSDDVLRKGVGHLNVTALPIGGEGNHTVLTGHTGLTTANMFNDLNKLDLDDLFYINVLDETLAYKVVQINVIEPSDTELLQPVEGEDLVTLVTCTPYGINSHRLLVRGERTDYIKEASQEQTNYKWVYILIAVVAIIVINVVIYKIRKQKHNMNKKEK